MSKLICIVGMCGAGKSEVSDYLVKKLDAQYLRFGQVVLDEILKKGLTPSESLEKEIRENLRKEHGMAAMALLNLAKIEEMLQIGDMIGDGLYSWEEYLVLKNKFGSRIYVIAVYAPAPLRYERLAFRSQQHQDDRKARFRSFSREDAISRDYAELEHLNKGGPIAIADYTLCNLTDLDALHQQIDLAIDNLLSVN